MKVLIVSDSHGDVENMCRAVELVKPRMLLHLGDGWHDTELLAERYPELPMERVPGNCDFRRGESAERVILLGGKRTLLCHGHTQGVKTGLGMLLRTALEKGVSAAFFGHTHRPFVDIRSGVLLLNPGSIGGWEPSYATLDLSGGGFSPAVHLL